MQRVHEVAVIGAGFGGLGAAVTLAERGAAPLVLEALTYPGGCASTFTRGGHAYEAGATLFSGLGESQLFGTWVKRHGLDVRFEWPDPLVELRTPRFTFATPRDRETFVDRMAEACGPHGTRVRAFLDRQRKVADALWSMLDDPTLLPPFDVRALLRHAGRLGKYAPLAGLVGRPLGDVLRADGLADVEPLRTWIDAVTQITVQCGAAEAEAPFALATMDYFFRGTGHVVGGIGSLAKALSGLVGRLGGEVRFGERVKAVVREDGGFRIRTSKGEYRARRVVANVLPQSIPSLFPEERRVDLGTSVAETEAGWSAAMLYLVLRPPEGAGEGAKHLELIGDATAPLVEGNHLFVSISSSADRKAPEGLRTVTISTHVDAAAWRTAKDKAAFTSAIQARMRRVLRERAPEWAAGVVSELPASPRTWERFTRRPGGLVGGIPRRAGLHHYRRLGPWEAAPGVFLVGDTAFPGQSVLATAIGGVKVAERLAGRVRVSGAA